jgi:hypothetical protein
MSRGLRGRTGEAAENHLQRAHRGLGTRAQRSSRRTRLNCKQSARKWRRKHSQIANNVAPPARRQRQPVASSAVEPAGYLASRRAAKGIRRLPSRRRSSCLPSIATALELSADEIPKAGRPAHGLVGRPGLWGAQNSDHAARLYSWRSPPRRSRRLMRGGGAAGASRGIGTAGSGGARLSERCGRWVL